LGPTTFVFFTLALVGALAWIPTDYGKPSRAAHAYVGSEACAGCHRGEETLWNGSHHKLAMDTQKSTGTWSCESLAIPHTSSTCHQCQAEIIARTEEQMAH
jgi:hypothetical protein